MGCTDFYDIQTMGMNAQNTNNRLYLGVTEPIVSCVNIRADKYQTLKSIGGTVLSKYDNFDRPKDQLNCPEPLCTTTGTLWFNFLTTTQSDVIIPTATHIGYKDNASTIDYINGVINYYLVFKEKGSYEVTTRVSDNDKQVIAEFKDTLILGDSEAYPKTIIIQHSMDEADSLLPATENGITIDISILPLDLESAGKTVGISSISMVEDKSDYEQNDVVVITCVDTLSLPIEIDVTDPSCLGQRPDATSVAPEFTVTAGRVSGNYLKLHALLHELDTTSAFDIEVIKKKIQQYTINGKTFWAVKLIDYFDEECGFISAYLDGCDALEGKLEYNTIKNLAEADTGTFKVIVDIETQERYMIFNEDYKNKDVTITYPISRDAKKYHANTNFTEGKKIRVVIPFDYANGYSGYIVSHNAFVSSFPFGWGREETPFEFTIKFLKDDKSENFFDVVIFDKKNIK